MEWKRIARGCAHQANPFRAFERGLASPALGNIEDIKLRRHRVGRAWEEFCRQVLMIRGYEEAHLLEDCPDSLLEQLRLGRRDVGIDILARKEGELGWTAVQCKFRARGAITWAQISTFAALCARSGPWARQLVMTNASHVRREGDRLPTDATMAKGTFEGLQTHEWLHLGGVDASGRTWGDGGRSATSHTISAADAREAFLRKLEANMRS